MPQMSDKHRFCRAYLRNARADAALAGVQVPRLSVYQYSLSLGSNKRFQVQDALGPVLYDGKAHCKYEARAKAIERLIDDARAAEWAEGELARRKEDQGYGVS